MIIFCLQPSTSESLYIYEKIKKCSKNLLTVRLIICIWIHLIAIIDCHTKEKKREMRINYSRLPIIRNFKGNRKKFELSGVRIIEGTVMENDVRELKITSSSREVRVSGSRLYLGLGFQQCMGFRATVRWTSIKQGCQKKAESWPIFLLKNAALGLRLRVRVGITVRVMVKGMLVLGLVSTPTQNSIL